MLEDDNCTVGTWPPIEELEKLTNLVKFENCPPDKKSLYICQFLMVQLWTMTDDQKKAIIDTIWKVYNINLTENGQNLLFGEIIA